MFRFALIAAVLLAFVPGGAMAVVEQPFIAEVSPDQPGTDALEFVELAGPPGLRLDGYRLVFFDSGPNSAAAYRSVDLRGHAIGSGGRLVIGAAPVDRLDLLAWTIDGIRNAGSRPAAVALYW